ncbi:MAG TPA: 50S ribosomal protein L19 [Candidatus Parcubacteria bacterium]|nr:50S ribosomal protein L19 [Candidatus Parcubacteria bacterium]
MRKEVIEFNLSQRSKKVPELRAGDVIKVHRKIKEGEKERVQVFEGIIIAINGKQSSSPTITVRKVSYGVGVELILPIYSPGIEKIELVKRAKVRRAKLYYIREKSAKSLRLKYSGLSDFSKAEEEKPEPKVEESEQEIKNAEKKTADNKPEKKSELKSDENKKTEPKKDESEKDFGEKVEAKK